MAIASGPRGINDGLIYFIDPSNVKSYAGVGTVIYDLSGNGKTSYFTNGAIYQNYQKGVVLVDGNNDYISTPLFNLGSPITVSAWVKNVINDSPVMGAAGPGVSYGNGEVLLYFSGKSIYIQGANSGGKYYQFPQLNLNDWVHLTMTRDVGNNMRVYLNGIGSTSNPQSHSNTIQMNQIGRYSSFTNQYNVRGSIGEVRIYNRSLSEQEIRQLYNSSRKKYLTSEEYVKDSLVLNLDFANPLCYPGTGNTAYDLSGFGHTAYLINGATHNYGWGGNIFCDGVDDYIETPTTSNFNFGSDNFSVEYWYRKVEYTSNYDNIWGISKWNTGANPGTNEWDLAIGNGFSSSIGETVGFGIESGSTIYTTGPLPASYNLNKFNHLVGIRNNNQLQVYYNGQQIYSNTPVGMTTSTSINNAGRNIRVSNSNLNQYYSKANSGIIRVYRKALTADEVRQNYRALLPRYSDPSIVTDGLILDYDFGSIETNRRTGSSAFNLAGTAFTGTLVNSPTFGTGGGGTVVINGTNQYISSNDPGISLPLSISVWIYFNATSGWNTFVCQDTTLAVPRAKFYFQRANLTSAPDNIIAGRINFTLTKSDGNVWVVNSRANPTISTWINYTVTLTSTSLKLYQDGVLQDSLSGSFSLQAGSGSVLYGAGYYSDVITDYSNLEFSRILIYNRALSETEIAQNYNNMRLRFPV